MQQLKDKIQVVIGEMNGELSPYQSGYKQCLINIQNDIDDQMLAMEKEQMRKTYSSYIMTNEDGNFVIKSFEQYYKETYGGKDE